MQKRIRSHIRSNVVGYAALFFALSGGVAFATHPGGANTINSADIINGEVKNNDLGENSVGSGKIADQSVKNNDLSLGASSSNTIADGGIQGVDVKNDTLGGAHIASGAIGTDELGNGTVTPDKIGTIPAVRATSPFDDPTPGACGFFPSIPGNGTLTPLKFVSEEFDTADMHALACVPERSRVTAPRTGVYQVSAGVVWTNNTTGTRFLGLRVNGNDDLFYAASRVPSLADIPEQSVSTLVRLSANEFVEAVVSQNSGSAIQLDSNFRRQHLAMHWVGPG
jgi:hypothetical protein